MAGIEPGIPDMQSLLTNEPQEVSLWTAWFDSSHNDKMLYLWHYTDYGAVYRNNYAADDNQRSQYNQPKPFLLGWTTKKNVPPQEVNLTMAEVPTLETSLLHNSKDDGLLPNNNVNYNLNWI